MIVIGIDPSMTQTAMIIGRSPTDFSLSLHRSKPLGGTAWHRVQRYDGIVAGIVRKIRQTPRQEDETIRIFIENYAFGCKFSREVMGELGGLIRWHLVDFDKTLVEVAPASLKRFVTGKGGAKKEVMLLKCQTTWGYEAQGNDEADAYGLWRLGLCVCGLELPKNVIQMQVVEKLRENEF